MSNVEGSCRTRECDVREKEAERSGLGVEVGPGGCYTREGEEEKGERGETAREEICQPATEQRRRDEFPKPKGLSSIVQGQG